MPTTLCPAKVNLFLEVIRKRPDGYHDLESIFLAVSLCDSLSAIMRDDGRITMECDDPSVPTGNDNLIIKAARLVQSAYRIQTGVHFIVKKRIPMGGGLGGGSTDAAGALRLVNQLWKLKLEAEQLAETGSAIGSDVPFFCYGGAALCEGRGEIVTPLNTEAGRLQLTLALSSLRSNTAAAYAGLQLPGRDEVLSAGPCIAALRTRDAGDVEIAAFNRFEPSVFAAMPELGALRALLATTMRKKVRMSGSGSALWYVGTADVAERAVADNAELAGLARKLAVRFVTVTACPPQADGQAHHPAFSPDRQD